MTKENGFKIVEKRMLNAQVGFFRLFAPRIAKKHEPGQFVILRVNEMGERIPLTIADSDPGDGTITIVVQGIGKTTELLNTLKAGDRILNLVGPLGTPTRIQKYGTVVMLGGGVGTAEVYPIGKKMKAAGNYTIGIIGARTKELLIFEDEMKRICNEVFVATDDGSYGQKGFVTELLKSLIEKGKKIDLVLAVGPVLMMKAVCNLTEPHKIPTLVSLNTIMVDGTGMCGSCRVRIGGERRFVCVDGPEFDGHKVDFDMIIARQRMYLAQEKRSLELFRQHKCRVAS